MDINKKIAEELGVKLWQVEAAVGLIDEGNTIPFIARYRKEVTGNLSDEVLRDFFVQKIKKISKRDKKAKTHRPNIEKSVGQTTLSKYRILF